MGVWLSTDGHSGLLDRSDARVSVFDHGLTVGDGVFETLKVIEGEPLALTRHLSRLQRSCDVLGLGAPDLSTIRGAVHEVVVSEPDASRLGRLRITVTAGDGPLASERGSAGGTVVVALSSMQPWPATTSAVVVPWVRNERSAVVGAKCTSYAENVTALAWAHERGFSEGLFVNTVGHLCEGTGTNVFVVSGDVVLTPGLDSGCLAGITRELLVEWGLAVEQHLLMTDLDSADEVFITSSTRDVHPVVKVGDRVWDTAGPVTKHVAAQYIRRITQDVDP